MGHFIYRAWLISFALTFFIGAHISPSHSYRPSPPATAPAVTVAASSLDRDSNNYYERQNWRFINTSLFLPSPVPTLIEEVFKEESPDSGKVDSVNFVINVPSRELTIYEERKAAKRYPVGVGQPRYKTPIGGKRFLSKIVWNPWWLPPDSYWARNAKDTPPGPRNPLGKAKMDLGNAILLHGTNKPHTVGRTRSHGCIRMKNKDVIELAWWIQKNFSNRADEKYLKTYQSSWRRSHYVPLERKIPVEIAYKRVEVRGDDLVIHPNVYHRSSVVAWDELLEELANIGIDSLQIDPEELPEELSVKESTTIPIYKILLDAEEWIASIADMNLRAKLD